MLYNLTSEELLKIQVRALQDSLPEKVKFRQKEVQLAEKENLAARRAIWYIIQRGWGISSAVSKVSGSFGCSPAKIERALRPVFPENYFEALEKSKRFHMIQELAEETSEEQLDNQ